MDSSIMDPNLQSSNFATGRGGSSPVASAGMSS